MEKRKDRDGLAAFLYERLLERYIRPVKTGEKNGFAIMACARLLIETLESFRNGWKSSSRAGSGGEIFDEFFRVTPRFAEFVGFGSAFYLDVRWYRTGKTTRGNASGVR
jgi:hypothetical protein